MASGGIAAVVESNRRAVAEFVAAAVDVSATRWMEPRSPGKWSPAQITEHVAIAYEIAGEIVDGTADIPGRKPARFVRPLIRMLVHATVLRTGRFYKSKTPVAYEPSSRSEAQHVLCDRLQRASDAFEQKARDKVGAGVNVLQHPYFGRFRIADLVTLQAHHARHHRLQIL
jgi:hypothetical protein